TEVWKDVLGMTGNPLVGVGFESFWLGPRLEKLWAIYQFHPNEAHNGYIETFLNLGWVGVALLTVLIWTGYRSVIRIMCQDPEAGRIRLAYLIVAINYNFTEAAFKTMHPVWIAFLLAIIAIPPRVYAKTGKRILRESEIPVEPRVLSAPIVRHAVPPV